MTRIAFIPAQGSGFVQIPYGCIRCDVYAICAGRTPRKDGVPKGIRTPVAAVKGRSPRPLDDGDAGQRVSDFAEPGVTELSASRRCLSSRNTAREGAHFTGA